MCHKLYCMLLFIAWRFYLVKVILMLVFCEGPAECLWLYDYKQIFTTPTRYYGAVLWFSSISLRQKHFKIEFLIGDTYKY